MEGFIEWLSKGWFYYGAIFAGLMVMVNSFKLVREIKENISRPIRDLTSKVDDLGKRFNTHVDNFDEYKAKQYRYKILEFSDSILSGIDHSKESYDDMLAIIDDYEEYCDDHPKFKNNRCKLSVDNIKTAYKNKFSYKEKDNE